MILGETLVWFEFPQSTLEKRIGGHIISLRSDAKKQQ